MFVFQHPRVRYAACNAVGQMSSDFAPIFEKKFHDKVIPGLLMVLDDNANPRVQAHAGAALVNFSEDCPKNILTPYLDAIMAKLESILTAKFQELVEKGTKLVLEQVRSLRSFHVLLKLFQSSESLKTMHILGENAETSKMSTHKPIF